MVDETLSQASYEALLKVKRDTAENVYSDVKDYNVPLVGDALVGDITVLDIRTQSEVLTDVPTDDSLILLSGSVDTYIGRRDG